MNGQSAEKLIECFISIGLNYDFWSYDDDLTADSFTWFRDVEWDTKKIVEFIPILSIDWVNYRIVGIEDGNWVKILLKKNDPNKKEFRMTAFMILENFDYYNGENSEFVFEETREKIPDNEITLIP